MANLTKEQRIAREAQKEAELKAKIEAEIEAKLRAEYEEKLKLAEEKTKEIPVENKESEIDKTSTARRIQNSVRIPLDTIVPVVCNIIGGAYYSSKKIMGYSVEWDDIGSVEYMELSELSSMKNTDKRFFEDNWIILEDTDEYTALQLYDFLKVSKYYKNVFTPETIDEIFTYNKDKIAQTISTLSRGMKETIAVRAKQKLDDNTLDKNIVDILEASLGIQFAI